MAGLMMVIVGGMIPSGFLTIGENLQPTFLSLPSTWQVPALLLCGLVCGSRAGVIAAVAYLTVGLFHLPIFHSGGGLSYLFTPNFGYLFGFIPAAWLSGRLAEHPGMNGLLPLTCAAFAGLSLLHTFGVLNLIIGSLMGRWSDGLFEMLVSYTLRPLLSQMALCMAVGILALALRRVLLIE